MTDTRQALAALLPCPFCGNSKGLAVANENPQDLSGGYFIACPSCDASTGLRFACGEDPIPLLIEQWNRRAALSAQPVAGAVEPTMPQWSDGPVKEQTIGEAFKAWRKAQTAPAPEPSVQAVAHPSHQTVREWMPVSEALRLSDLWTAGDLDNCGQWRAAIKVLADEVRALAASPQPEPSAQGEPVAFDRMEVRAIVQQAYLALEELQGPGFLIGGVMHYRIGLILPKLNEAINALASAPSTPPHAVVEAVPLEWTEELGPMPGTPYNHCAASTPFGRFLITWKGWKENDWPTVDETPWGDFFGSWRTVKEAQAACEAEYAIRLLRGIAPKAAQPNV